MPVCAFCLCAAAMVACSWTSCSVTSICASCGWFIRNGCSGTGAVIVAPSCERLPGFSPVGFIVCWTTQHWHWSINELIPCSLFVSTQCPLQLISATCGRWILNLHRVHRVPCVLMHWIRLQGSLRLALHSTTHSSQFQCLNSIHNNVANSQMHRFTISGFQHTAGVQRRFRHCNPTIEATLTPNVWFLHWQSASSLLLCTNAVHCASQQILQQIPILLASSHMIVCDGMHGRHVTTVH